jgi:integrase
MSVFLKEGNWWIDYYDADGRRHRKKIGPQKTLAVMAIKEAQVKRAKGELGYLEDKRILFKDFANNYVKHIKVTLSPFTLARCLGIIDKRLVPEFGQFLLPKITRKHIEDYMNKRASAVSPATVNREMSRLRHIFSTAVRWRYIRESPCKGIKEFKESSGRIRYLTPEELDRLLTACDSSCFADNKRNKTVSELLKVYLKPIVLLSCHLGTRRSELINLTWRDIDFKQRHITLDHTKNGERRFLYMNDTVWGILKSLPVSIEGEGKVFAGITPNMVTMAFRRAANRAGLTDVRFHDLRHTFASHLVMNGTNIRTVQTLLGHKDLRMTLRYSHLSPEHLQEAVTGLDKVLQPNSNSHYLGTEKEKDLTDVG